MRSRRQLTLILAVSAALHGTLYLGLTQLTPVRAAQREADVIEIVIEPRPSRARAPKQPPARAPQPATQPVIPAEQPVTRVAPTTEPPTTEPSITEPTASRRAPTQAVARVAPRTQRSEPTLRPEIAPEAAGQDAPRNPLLAMRTRATPRAPETRGSVLIPSPAAAAALAASGGALASRPTDTPQRSPLELPDAPRVPGAHEKRPKGMMIPDGNGTYRFDHSGFTAKVARDGRVTIKDKPSFQPYAKGPCFTCVREDLAEYFEAPGAGQAVNLMALIPSVGVRFDLTDWVMRKSGAGDPYSYQKDKFMNATREQREAMWHAESAVRLREALQVLPAQLADIWGNKTWTARDRRRVLFDLWDECSETGEAARVRLGRQIRATILAFIRKRMPAGSQHAYSDAELAQLNRGRSSRATFDPYPRPDARDGAAGDTGEDAAKP